MLLDMTHMNSAAAADLNYPPRTTSWTPISWLKTQTAFNHLVDERQNLYQTYQTFVLFRSVHPCVHLSFQHVLTHGMMENFFQDCFSDGSRTVLRNETQIVALTSCLFPTTQSIHMTQKKNKTNVWIKWGIKLRMKDMLLSFTGSHRTKCNSNLIFYRKSIQNFFYLLRRLMTLGSIWSSSSPSWSSKNLLLLFQRFHTFPTCQTKLYCINCQTKEKTPVNNNLYTTCTHFFNQ